MLSTKARPQLDTLIRQLKDWEESVPKQARRFHDIRAQLDRDIHGAIPVWALWVAGDVVQRFRDRVDRLHNLTGPLVELVRECETLGEEVRRLRDASPASDVELAAWLQKRTRDWLALLGRLGGNCERDADVASDRMLYERTEAAVRLHHEPVHQLIEADTVLATLGTDVRAAGLAGLLPQLRRRLFEGGATPDWLEEIRSFLQPLRAVASRIQDPPRELNDAAALLTELRGWWAILGSVDETRRAIERLEERRFRVADWEQEEVQELIGEARRLRELLLEQVEQTRSGVLLELEQGLTDLRQACGDQPDLTARLAELAPRQSHRPQLFRDWLAHAEKFRHSFKAIAQSHILTLETRLAETRERAARTLDQLEHRPLSDAVRNDVAVARHDLAAVRDSTQVEEILVALRTMNEIARQVDTLELRAGEDLVAVQLARHELAAKYDLLASELRRVRGVELDLSGAARELAALDERAAERTLEDHRRETAALASRLDDLTTAFIDRCRERLAEHQKAAQRAHDVLRDAGASPPSIIALPAEAGATPQDAASAVMEARRQQNVLLRLARVTREDLETRLLRASSDLRNIRPHDLGPADRQRAQQLLRDLEGVAQARHRSPVDAVEAIAAVTATCERFFDALQQEQRGARERLAELRRQFREFAEDQLPRFCPELSDRVAALIYGVPEHPRQWSAVHHQLDRAADLLARVRTQAQRLAADEVDRAAENLRTRIRAGGPTGFRDAAQKALAELDGCGTEQLPPTTLRQRVVNISQRRA